MIVLISLKSQLSNEKCVARGKGLDDIALHATMWEAHSVLRYTPLSLTPLC